MKRRILTDRGEGNNLAKLFGCSPIMISNALTFKTNSILARRIRKAAIERGGIDIQEVLTQNSR